MSRNTQHVSFLATAALVGGLFAAFGAVAQQGGAPQNQPAPSQPGHGPMGGMMGMMGQMDPAQMNRMMENCNRMMESMLRNHGAPTPPAPSSPDQRG